ncbi:hypothetical protein ACFX12_030162 [Malus domestica]
MPKGLQCKVSLQMVYPMGKDIQLINVLNLLRMKMLGVIKAIANHGTTCFPTLTIRIGEIIQITCGENINNSNKMGIGSKKRNAIQDLCSHHNNLPNSGTSLDNDMFNKLLTSLNQEVENGNKEMQNQAKKTGELEKQIGQIMEFMAQIQEQSELSNSTIENLKEDFEIHDAITLGSAMEVGGEPKTSKRSQNMDKQLLLEELENNKAMAREEPPLPQPHMPSMLSTTTKVSLNSICPDPLSPNVLIPCMQSKEEEGEKHIFETFPKNQKQEVDGECLEFIKEDTLETKIPKEVGFYDTGQVITLKTPNLAKSHIPATFKDVAPTLEFKPLPDQVKYHLLFKDQFHAMGPIQV